MKDCKGCLPVITARPDCAALSPERLPGVGKIICLDSTESTQIVGRELAAEGAAERTLILAGTQTSGHGRLGREWESGAGGVYMTLLLKPETGLEFLGDLSVLTGEVVAEAMANLYGIKTRIKKPNDVYAWSPRRRGWFKISGVLTESASTSNTPAWLLLGIGINLNNTVKLATGTSVKAITGSVADRAEFLHEFFRIFWLRYAAWAYSSQARS